MISGSTLILGLPNPLAEWSSSTEVASVDCVDFGVLTEDRGVEF
jgi:hypothetical protein